MRILVTNQGLIQVDLLKTEHEVFKDKQEKQKIKDALKREQKVREKKMLKSTMSKIKQHNYNKNRISLNTEVNNINQLTSDNNIYNASNFNTLNNMHNNQIKEIQVKQKKINVHKSIQEKYNYSNYDGFNTNKSNYGFNFDGKNDVNSIIVPSIPTSLTDKKKLINKDGSRKKYLNVKDILKEETIESLKKQKLNNKRVKEINSVITSKNFRTNYAEKDVIVDLFEKLDVEIDINMINLIKYLHNKDNVSEKFIKQFDSFSKEKINKLNKICQILHYNNDKLKIDKFLIDKKLKSNENKFKLEYKEIIDDAKMDINIGNMIINSYNFNKNKYAIYGEKLKEIKKYWSYTNAENLQRTTNKFNFDSFKTKQEFNNTLSLKKDNNLSSNEEYKTKIIDKNNIVNKLDLPNINNVNKLKKNNIEETKENNVLKHYK